MKIDDWVRRHEPGTKWHLVESVVDEAAVTKCGRTMEPTNADGVILDTSDVMPLTRMIGQPQLCRYCDR